MADIFMPGSHILLVLVLLLACLQLVMTGFFDMVPCFW